MNNSKRQILLVEDNPDDVELIQVALAELNMPHEVIYLTDGQQAIDYVLGRDEFADQPKLENPAIIILDLKLPKIAGFEILKLIRANPHTMHAPVVIFTSSNIQADISMGYQLGANSIITKPTESKLFADCVKLVGSYWLLWNHPFPGTK